MYTVDSVKETDLGFLSLYLTIYLFRGRVSWPQTHQVVKHNLEFLILLLLFPKCWAFRHAPLCQLIICKPPRSLNAYRITLVFLSFFEMGPCVTQANPLVAEDELQGLISLPLTLKSLEPAGVHPPPHPTPSVCGAGD